MSTLPTFLIIGAQKSGTSSLVRYYLGSHPQIFTLPKEVHYFDRRFERGIDWYESQFAAARDEIAIGESTPEYLYQEAVPARIARTLPEARLVAILRDPVDRAYSHYWHNRTRGHEPLSFVDALAAEPERTGDADPRVRERFAYAGRGRYLDQLQRYTELVSRDALHVVVFEELRNDRHTVLRRLFGHLGVDTSFTPDPDERPRNPFIEFRSQRLRRPIRRLPGPVRRAAARLNMRQATYPPLPPSVRTQVGHRFRACNDRLADWLGRDLSAWGDISVR